MCACLCEQLAHTISIEFEKKKKKEEGRRKAILLEVIEDICFLFEPPSCRFCHAAHGQRLASLAHHSNMLCAAVVCVIMACSIRIRLLFVRIGAKDLCRSCQIKAFRFCWDCDDLCLSALCRANIVCLRVCALQQRGILVSLCWQLFTEQRSNSGT